MKRLLHRTSSYFWFSYRCIIYRQNGTQPSKTFLWYLPKPLRDLLYIINQSNMLNLWLCVSMISVICLSQLLAPGYVPIMITTLTCLSLSCKYLTDTSRRITFKIIMKHYIMSMTLEITLWMFFFLPYLKILTINLRFKFSLNLNWLNNQQTLIKIC